MYSNGAAALAENELHTLPELKVCVLEKPTSVHVPVVVEVLHVHIYQATILKVGSKRKRGNQREREKGTYIYHIAGNFRWLEISYKVDQNKLLDF